MTKPFCDEAVRLGMHAIEVSGNVVTLDDDERRAIIGAAVECGLEVHGEAGSKSEGSGAQTLVAQARPPRELRRDCRRSCEAPV